MGISSKPRLLVFVIAYRAESTLKQVLERIPAQVFADYDYEILVVDDASTDRTFEIGWSYKKQHPHVRMTVLRNQINQGYGGNQKVGYSYAIEEGFDYVAMVHGDGQYAPEELPTLLLPLKEGKADAVFGSRMMTQLGALKGGMPLYKYVGNRILTTLQNQMLGTNLSEFHSGYRIYSVETLKEIPFHLNSDDFHFDTEIIIQLVNQKRRIVELPIPTYYGDEICHVDGLKYAADVVRATLANVFHRNGLLYQRKFDPDPSGLKGNIYYDAKLGYPSSHQMAIDRVPVGSTVLDIGAGPGSVSRALHAKGCKVTVVDQHKAVDVHGEVRVVTQDLDQAIEFDIKPFDHLLMLDVVEHLKSPEKFFDELRKQFTYETKTLLLTTPNIAFVVPRLMLLLGQFNYSKAGILDITHTRLFTFRTLQRLLRDSGFRIQEVQGVPVPFPKVFGETALSRALLQANLAAIRLSKTLFSYQILVVAETAPDVSFVLASTRHASTAPQTTSWPSERHVA